MDKDKDTVKKRYIELDGLRGLAALTVFFAHAINMVIINNYLYNFISNSILHIFWDGDAAVILFFVLSGFVLSMPYLGENNKPLDTIPFLIRRIFRIYPAYILGLIICVALKLLIFNPEGLSGFSELATKFWQWRIADIVPSHIIKHVTMVGPNFSRITMGIFDPVIWSLVVEMKISLVFPIVIFILQRINSLLGACVFLITSLAGFLIVMFSKSINLLGHVPMFFMDYIRYLPLFILGALIAKYRTTIISKLSNIPTALSVVLGFIAIVLYTSRFSLHWLKINELLIDYIIGLGVAMMITFALSIPKLSSILSSRIVKFFGDISYSLYLLHFPILLAFVSVIYPKTHSLLLSWGVSLIMTIIISFTMYKAIEMPFQKMGRSLANYIKNLQVYLDKTYIGKLYKESATDL